MTGSSASSVAVVHEWIASRAGSELVFEALASTWPNADLYALSREPGVELDLGGRPLTKTILDNGLLRNRRSVTLPVMPVAWWRLGRGDYDVVVTSHHAFASSNRLAAARGTHLCYVHAPARYVWTPDLDPRGAGRALAPARALLRRVDRAAADRVTSFAANSREIARRIEECYDRESTVINPPVDTEFFTPGEVDASSVPYGDGFLLGLGRWIPYKQMDAVIRLGERTGRPVVIAGHGPLGNALRAQAREARVPVTILERPSREVVRDLFRAADALVFPTVEDFGIVPVEVMACGTPVLAYDRGGASETVLDGVSGALVPAGDETALVEGLERAVKALPSDCVDRADRFGYARFRSECVAWLDDVQRSARV